MDGFGTYFTHVQKALLWTWQPAHMEHTKYTAVRTKVYIQQNHSACTDEALGRVYRWGPWPRVQTRPLPLRPWPEPSACTCDPGPEPSACPCDPRKRVHRRPPDLLGCPYFWKHPPHFQKTNDMCDLLSHELSLHLFLLSPPSLSSNTIISFKNHARSPHTNLLPLLPFTASPPLRVSPRK